MPVIKKVKIQCFLFISKEIVIADVYIISLLKLNVHLYPKCHVKRDNQKGCSDFLANQIHLNIIFGQEGAKLGVFDILFTMKTSFVCM